MGKKDKAQRQKRGAMSLVVIGCCLIAPSFHILGLGANLPTSEMAFAGLICVGLGLVRTIEAAFAPLLGSRKLPAKEVLRLAEERKGLLTLSEIITALDIDPEVARRTLESLSKSGIASQRWQEFRKNIWEFPDYMTLPISESLDLAKNKGGRLTVDDLVANGHSRQEARETLDALEEKGLAQPDGNSASSAVIVTTQ